MKKIVLGILLFSAVTSTLYAANNEQSIKTVYELVQIGHSEAANNSVSTHDILRTRQLMGSLCQYEKSFCLPNIKSWTNKEISSSILIWTKSSSTDLEYCKRGRESYCAAYATSFVEIKHLLNEMCRRGRQEFCKPD